jgi:hypothetical protein
MAKHVMLSKDQYKTIFIGHYLGVDIFRLFLRGIDHAHRADGVYSESSLLEEILERPELPSLLLLVPGKEAEEVIRLLQTQGFCYHLTTYSWNNSKSFVSVDLLSDSCKNESLSSSERRVWRNSLLRL